MLRYLIDPANAVTSFGILSSGVALYLALRGHIEAATAIGLWAMLADQLDGILARKTPGRSPDVAAIGKSLDGFSDIIYGAVLPSVVILALLEDSLASLLIVPLMLLAGSIRLSYFNSYGLLNGNFTGVPLSYNLPILALFFLVRAWLPEDVFSPLVVTAFILLAGLHVSSLRIPAPGRAMYLGLVIYSTLASGTLLVRAFLS